MLVMTPGSLRARKPWGYGWLLLPAAAAFTAGWVGLTRDGGSLLEGVVRLVASALVMAVAAGAAHEAVDRRNWGRHASIRADIAAAGGLNRRLMV